MYTRPRIIPVLSVNDGDLVKTKKFQDARYLGDPVNAVKIFNIKGVDEMAILDIRATKRNKEPDYAMLKDIAAQAFMPLSYGGGIKSVGQARRLFAIGFEKIIVNTAFYKNPSLIKDLSATFGSQSIVVSIDAKRTGRGYTCVACSGTLDTQKSPAEMAVFAEQMGAGEILIQSVSHDGMMGGYDLPLIKDVASKVSVPVISCAGAARPGDFKAALDAGAHAAAAGSMFVFYGRLRAVLIHMPSEQELIGAGVYGDG